jgi:hypothetical protein
MSSATRTDWADIRPETHTAPELGKPQQPWLATEALRTFDHLSEGCFNGTQRALKDYLKSKGVPAQSYTAELIMFMERSFKGKYLKNERSHHQRIMRGRGRWREGDTLSEKLTRCTDKETFKARFDRIGTTAILSRGHFEEYEVANLDFKGRLYLRLIDTNRKNLSIFYRNDGVVEEFFRTVHVFCDNQLQAAADVRWRTGKKAEVVDEAKAEVSIPTKPAVLHLENPKPLLTRDLIKEEAEARRGHLTLIYSSSGEKKKEKRVEMGPRPIRKARTNDRSSSCSGLGAGSLGAAPATNTPGLEVFQLWRAAVMSHDPSVCITKSHTSAQLRSAALLKQKFDEFLPGQPLPEFFQYLTSNWPQAKKSLECMGVWKALGDYPELPLLVEESDKVLTLYKREFQRAAKLNTKRAVIAPPAQKQSQVPPPIQPPYIGCERATAAGRTFRGVESESLEYQIVAHSRSKFGAELANIAEELLEQFSIDLPASRARIQELCKLPEHEFEKYCC